MKNLYNAWYRERIALINKVAEAGKRINLLDDLLVEWDDNYSGSEDAKRIHRWIKKKIKDEKKKINQQSETPETHHRGSEEGPHRRLLRRFRFSGGRKEQVSFFQAHS